MLFFQDTLFINIMVLKVCPVNFVSSYEAQENGCFLCAENYVIFLRSGNLRPQSNF